WRRFSTCSRDLVPNGDQVPHCREAFEDPLRPVLAAPPVLRVGAGARVHRIAGFDGVVRVVLRDQVVDPPEAPAGGDLAPGEGERVVVRDLLRERRPRLGELAQMAGLLVLDRTQAPHVRESGELSREVAVELDRPQAQALAERPGVHSVLSSSARPAVPGTTMSARARSAGGASAESTATLTPASSSSIAAKASRSDVSSPANSALARPARASSARTAAPLFTSSGGSTSSTIRPNLARKPSVRARSATSSSSARAASWSECSR